VDSDALGEILSELRRRGYETVGPTVREGAIVYDTISGLDDLPVGWTDRQAPGTYRLERRDDERRFGYVVPQDSWKRFVFPPSSVVWAGERTEQGFVTVPEPEPPRVAIVGARPCELAAIAVQDRVFLGDRPDPTYAARREQLFVVAVNCDEPKANCFCASMGTGPGVTPGVSYDLALTEVVVAGEVRYLAESGSEAGEELLAAVGVGRAATADEVREAAALVTAAAASMTKSLDTADLKELLQANLRSAHWGTVGGRCLSCANCTLVCPTCFCATVEDHLSLDGQHASRVRVWDSCFTLDFSYIHGGSLRSAPSARYRQWLTHKLSTWVDQFGVFGCVGCGRCITWCPVGIDLVAEVAAIRDVDERAGAPVPIPEVRT
jgi:ferredoxin